ncbi:hypothetical protein CA2559_10118 [Croceibacter atlanticus HTCC2559]|uniref:Uncharacterized protein n=1 Tax=Croceibacter atlanticus (strain ATCC BAA-628 / JCM 21780 / CIP 108009 / IAM 15332 / KCTC 12090 / HTCC2559) TaxID=216432 RepID=A3U996_CROAH|nr:hypothetical protein CA2559_10118 [Croceibacter atlanticus HTCC2559]
MLGSANGYELTFFPIEFGLSILAPCSLLQVAISL